MFMKSLLEVKTVYPRVMRSFLEANTLYMVFMKSHLEVNALHPSVHEMSLRGEYIILRVPATIAAIRQDGSLSAKSHIPVPLKYVFSNTSMMKAKLALRKDITGKQQPLPLSSASAIPG